MSLIYVSQAARVGRFRAHVACMLLGARIRYGFELLRLGALLLVKSKEV